MALRETDDIVQRALTLGLVGPEKRRLLLEGLPMGFVYSLPTVSRPIDQLRFDLMELGRTPRLIGLAGPPLAVWLRNAATIAQDLARGDDAMFFAQKASALDGKPLELDVSPGPSASPGGRGPDQTGGSHVGSVSNGSAGIVHGNVTFNNYGDRGPAATPAGESAPRPAAPKAPTPLTERELIVLAVGVPEPDAREAVGAGVKIRKVVLVDAPVRTWTHPPTHEAWGHISRQIEGRLGEWLDPAAPADIALVGELPAAMSAWFVHTVRQRNAGLTAFVADPPWYSPKNRWHFPRPAPGTQSAVDVKLDGPTDAVRALAVYVDLSGRRRKPAAAGCKTTAVITAHDSGWRHGEVRPAALARALIDALGDLQRRFADATWHVFYEGPPSLWCAAVAQALRDAQPMTIYAADGERAEHAALTLPHGIWQTEEANPDETTDFDAFIAYPVDARDLAHSLYTRLAADGRSVFLDEVSLEWGDARNQVIDAALQSARTIIVMITPDTDRDWYELETVRTAIDLAMGAGAELRIVPLLVGDVAFGSIPFGLRRLHPARLKKQQLEDKVVSSLIKLIEKSRADATD